MLRFDVSNFDFCERIVIGYFNIVKMTHISHINLMRRAVVGIMSVMVNNFTVPKKMLSSYFSAGAEFVDSRCWFL